MGMRIGVCTLGDDNLEKVVADPQLLWHVLVPDQPPPHAAARDEAVALMARLCGRAVAPTELHIAPGEVVGSNLDKAWHGIHYLLTGESCPTEWPLDFLLVRGRRIGDRHSAYVPARGFTSGEVATINRALDAIGDEELRSRFDPVRMMAEHVYPCNWNRLPADTDGLAYCLAYYKVLQAFVAETAQRRMGMVLFMT